VVTPIVTSSYSVTGTSAEGCQSSNTAVSSVSVQALPVISVTSGTICEGESFTLTASGANTYTFSGGSAVVSPTSNTSYSVTGTSAEGCISSDAAVSSVLVNMLPAVSVSGTNSVCAGNSVVLTANGALTYSWSTSSATSSISVSPAATTTYSVIGTDANGCEGIAQYSVTVNPLPVITVANSNTLICEGESASLAATGAETYSWSSGETGSMILVTPAITSTYSVLGLDANGCANSAVVTQSVVDCTGIQTAGETTSAIDIYPNPNTGEFTIKAEGVGSLFVINDIGQRVSAIELKGNSSYQVSLKNLPAGIYFINGNIGNQRIHKKVILVD
jgi:hypothetical protein